ncbi:MAG TPA: protein TolQ [Gammaproteobacteria bacterium]|jgi:biopolymer transport protein TolQ|nr:protein TolQ [Gammaproteobacteria bacterium]
MNGEESFLEIALHASLVVKLVLLLLMAASLASWAMIFRKHRMLKEARTRADEFEKRFWSGGDLAGIYKEICNTGAETGMETLFEAGFSEFARLRKQSDDQAQVIEGARRAMRVAQIREVDRLEESLAFLATVGSTSPYVGLFGTVWGIMNAFHSLGNVQHATIAMVAPGISEALIATAMGLFAAIPAVIAYNRYANHVERLETRFDSFLEEFSTILQRHVGTRAGHG